MKILLVEDEEVLLKSLSYKLTEQGFEVVTAIDGQEAIMSLDQDFAVILVDLMMPNIDGWQLLTKISGKNNKVVVLSNLSQPEDVRRAKALGVDEFVTKSNVTLKEIVELVKRLTT